VNLKSRETQEFPSGRIGASMLGGGVWLWISCAGASQRRERTVFNRLSNTATADPAVPRPLTTNIASCSLYVTADCNVTAGRQLERNLWRVLSKHTDRAVPAGDKNAKVMPVVTGPSARYISSAVPSAGYIETSRGKSQRLFRKRKTFPPRTIDCATANAASAS